MSTHEDLGGVIHTYQKYDPVEFPSPTAPPPDLVSPAFEHLLHYGSTRRLTEEELARAVRLDPSQIRGFGPTLEALMDMLRERKRKILETYETSNAEREAHQNFHGTAETMKPPSKLARPFQEAVREEQLHDLEQLWYRSGDERGEFARQLLNLSERLGEKYQVDRAGLQVRIHRSDADVGAESAGDQGGAGGDRQAAGAAQGGDEKRPDRRHRHGRASSISLSRAIWNSSTTSNGRSRSTCGRWPSSRDWSEIAAASR